MEEEEASCLVDHYQSFPAQLDACPEEAYTHNIPYTTVGLVFRLLSATIIKIHSVLFSQHWTVKREFVKNAYTYS